MRYLAFFLLLLPCISCVKDKPTPGSPADVTLSDKKKVYIINEGNFGTGNSSVSLFDPETENVIEDYYRSQNNEGTGDVLQSLAASGRKLLLVVNNSGKVIVCDRELRKEKEIRGLSSPRHFLEIDHTKAYITDLKADKIHIVDLNSMSVTGSISCKGWTEQMCAFQNNVFVTNITSEYLYVISSVTDQMIDSVRVGPNANGCLVDSNKKLWVLNGGDQMTGKAASLARFDLMSLQREIFLELGNDMAGSLQTNSTRTRVYYLQKDVFLVDVNASPANPQKIILSEGKNFYGLGIHPDTEEIYVSDALDYSQRSNIYIYTREGQQSKVFKAGINTNGFYFE